MVASLCVFGHKSPKRILPSTDQENVHQRRPDTLTESIFKCIKPRCNWSITKKKKIQPNVLHQQQNTKQQQEQQHQTLKNDHKKVVTLEEWILASPGPNDFKLSRQSPYKSRVYPSTNMHRHHQHGRKSSLTVDAERDYSSTSLTSQSGNKIKKRVSFRLPEVADIFILDDTFTHA